uniref:HAT C-terminal dimerisation domain-containing protein n=1 Tax=Latimeria chalumnae TaxID=7897 RepID=H3A4Y1_LATCH
WLVINGSNVGCSVCQQVSNLGPEKSAGMKLSKQWIESSVSSSAVNKTKQQKALQKSAQSKSHVTACRILEQAKKDTLFLLKFLQWSESSVLSIKKQSTTVECIDCQQLNGLDMGCILHSNITCSNIQHHISSEIKKKLFAQIVVLAPKVSVLLDEATAVNRNSALIVYMQMQLPGMESPVNVFVNLVELNDLSSEGILNSLLSVLKKVNVTEDFLAKCLVAVACNGTSVMFWCNTGVVKRLQDMFPNIIAWHCSAQYPELAVSDVMKDVGATNHFKSLLDKLYSLCSTSVKKRFELKEYAEALDIYLCKTGRVLDTQWVALSFRTVEAVWNAYPVLYKHFTTTHKTYSGLSKWLLSVQFISNLGIMYDVLQELSELSLELQERDCTIINRQISVFKAMVEKRGKYSAQCEKAIEEKMFQGKPCDKKIHSGQFYCSLANNLRNCMLSTGGSAGNKTGYEKLMTELKVLYKQYWPDELPTLYGESEIESLCERFDIGNARETVWAYRVYKESGGKEVQKQYKDLLIAVNTIAISSAECEQSFSQMNLICTPTRESMLTETISSLLLLNLVSPPLKKFNPIPYVHSWLAKGHRAADNTRSKERKHEDKQSNMEILWAFL